MAQDNPQPVDDCEECRAIADRMARTADPLAAAVDAAILETAARRHDAETAALFAAGAL